MPVRAEASACVQQATFILSIRALCQKRDIRRPSNGQPFSAEQEGSRIHTAAEATSAAEGKPAHRQLFSGTEAFGALAMGPLDVSTEKPSKHGWMYGEGDAGGFGCLDSLLLVPSSVVSTALDADVAPNPNTPKNSA